MAKSGRLQVTSLEIAYNGQVRGWYSCSHGQSMSGNILQDAYADAQSIFQAELTQNENWRTLIAETSTLEDVRQILEDARVKYDIKQTSKARKWLGAFSSKIMFYASVLDVLVQHHPEYVSLAWGAMKLLFAGVINNEEMVRQLSKSFSQIADTLPRTDLSLVLYPTEMMKEAVARLYAYILKFIMHAVRWYKQGKFAHAWAAIANPWALSFESHFENIAEQARHVEELARSASRAELRDAHLEIREVRGELREARKEVQALSKDVTSQTRQLMQIALASQSVHAQIQIDLSESKSMIANIQLGQILTMPFAENLPASGESLRFCQSMVKRRRDRARVLLPDLAQLQAWSDYPRSSFMITESASGQAAKAFLVDLVDLIRKNDRRILWALRFPSYWERDLTGVDILRMLLIQSLQVNPGALTSKDYPITMTHLCEAVDEKDWLALLSRALAGLPYVYIILDADLLGHATGQDRYLATKLIETFPRIVTSTIVKLIVSTACVDEQYASNNWDPQCWKKLRTDTMDTRKSIRGRRRRPLGHNVRRLNKSRSWL